MDFENYLKLKIEQAKHFITCNENSEVRETWAIAWEMHLLELQDVLRKYQEINQKEGRETNELWKK